jgi:protein-S-isoprenylcysteine O-methyltransferase Ste14
MMVNMAVLSLIFCIVYFAIAFVLKIWLHHKRTGAYGIRIPWKQGGFMGKFGTVLFSSALLCFTAAPLADLAGVIDRIYFDRLPWLGYLGLVLAVSGLVLTVVAQAQMGESWRVGVNPREVTPLVTNGLYAHVRNPIFSGVLLAGAGLLLMTPNLLSILGMITLWMAIELQVRWFEEPYLARTHRQKFLDYAGQTGRFVPGVGIFYDLEP